MKRSLFFWPVVSAGVVFFLWLGLCFCVIGFPAFGRPGSPDFWSPALQLLGGGARIELTRWFVSVVNEFWSMAPYCRIRKSHPQWARYSRSPVGLDIGPSWSPSRRVIVSPLPSSLHSSRDVPMVQLSPREVLAYVVLMPGAHFAAVVLILAAAVSLVVRLLLHVILPAGGRSPEDAEEASEP